MENAKTYFCDWRVLVVGCLFCLGFVLVGWVFLNQSKMPQKCFINDCVAALPSQPYFMFTCQIFLVFVEVEQHQSPLY